MLKFITILDSLKAKPRRLTIEEDRYLDELTDELRRADSDTARWRILEREGLAQLDIEAYGFDADLLDHLLGLRRASMS